MVLMILIGGLCSVGSRQHRGLSRRVLQGCAITGYYRKVYSAYEAFFSEACFRDL